MTSMRGSVLRAILTVSAAGVLSLGCEGESEPEDPSPEGSELEALTKAHRENKSPLLNGAEIQAAGKTPAATVLRWWRLIQFSASPSELLKFYASSGRPSRRQFETQTAPLRYYFTTRKPIVTDQQLRGRTAQVFTVISTSSNPDPTKADPVVFNLTTSGSEWRLTSNDFLRRRYQQEVQFREQQSRKPPAPEPTPTP